VDGDSIPSAVLCPWSVAGSQISEGSGVGLGVLVTFTIATPGRRRRSDWLKTPTAGAAGSERVLRADRNANPSTAPC
jgi:hypothetical protein